MLVSNQDSTSLKFPVQFEFIAVAIISKKLSYHCVPAISRPTRTLDYMYWCMCKCCVSSSSSSRGYYLWLNPSIESCSWIDFISVAYAADTTEPVAEHSARLQPSINLHAPVTAFMFSCFDLLNHLLCTHIFCLFNSRISRKQRSAAFLHRESRKGDVAAA